MNRTISKKTKNGRGRRKKALKPKTKRYSLDTMEAELICPGHGIDINQLSKYGRK